MSRIKKFIIPIIVVLFLLIIVFVYINMHNRKSDVRVDLNNITISKQDKDPQPYWSTNGSHNIAAAEDGYYYITSSYMMYLDADSLESIPLCGKADCAHNTIECNAYIGDEIYVLDNIYYYDGYVYYMPIENGIATLTRIDKSGAVREKIGELMPSNGSNSILLTFNGLYAYATDFVSHIQSTEEHTERIVRISLEDGSTDTAYETTGTGLTIKNVKSFGDRLYFIVHKSDVIEKGKRVDIRSLGLYAYNCENMQVEKISENNIFDYYLVEDKNRLYYYVTGSGLYYSDLTTNEQKQIMKPMEEEKLDMCEVSYDGKYLYLSNLSWSNYIEMVLSKASAYFVLDLEGNLINKIPCPYFLEMEFGDDRYLFAWMMGEQGVGDNGFVYIDKKEIETCKEWTRVNEKPIDLLDWSERIKKFKKS